MQIRVFRVGEEPALRALLHASVHQLAAGHYSRAQCEAWAPADFDAERWAAQIRRNRPWVAEDAGGLLGFADLQADGHIDLLFVAPAAARRGVGSARLQFVIAQARQQGMARLTADVSLSAEALFRRQGFVLLQRQQVERAGVVLENARMALPVASITPV